jgi:hypothetical protein
VNCHSSVKNFLRAEEIDDFSISTFRGPAFWCAIELFVSNLAIRAARN